MTKVIVITNKSDITSDFVILRLKEKQVPFYRFNTDELTKSVFVSLNFSSGEFLLFDTYQNKYIDLLSFTSVYYRRPELPEIKSSQLSNGEFKFIASEILFTLEGVYKVLEKAFWVSDPYAIRQAENKPYQLLVAKRLGLNIPDSLITNDPNLFNKFVRNGERIIKPIKSGLIEDGTDDKIIFTSLVTTNEIDEEQIIPCPQFIQEHIVKVADIRTTIVGNKIFTARIDSQQYSETKVDWRRGENSLNHSTLVLPKKLNNKLIQLVKYFNLQFGAIDLIQDVKGEYHFLEINPNGQWAWIEKQTGMKISDEIVNLLVNEKN